MTAGQIVSYQYGITLYIVILRDSPFGRTEAGRVEYFLSKRG
jgi:hypothetical protein